MEHAEARSFWKDSSSIFHITLRHVVAFDRYFQRHSGRSGWSSIDGIWPGTILIKRKSCGEDLGTNRVRFHLDEHNHAGGASLLARPHRPELLNFIRCKGLMNRNKLAQDLWILNYQEGSETFLAREFIQRINLDNLYFRRDRSFQRSYLEIKIFSG